MLWRMMRMRHNLAEADASTEDPAFEELKAFLVSATGNFRLSAKDSRVQEKVSGRLRHNGLSSFDAYLKLLKDGVAGKRELDCLIAELTVGETFFFRHPEHFDALRDDALPACVKRNERSRQLRIWSAGCANGAEAYSIAILVHSVLGDRLADWNVTIVGSDINRVFLAEAEAGAYTAWTMRGVPNEQIPGFFSRRGALWTVRDKYKKNVRFVYHNLINDDVPSLHDNIFAFDVIFCRNVMIYFDSAINRLLAHQLNEALVDDGWLFVGSTDFNAHLDSTFALEKQSHAIVYRKRKHPAAVSRNVVLVDPGATRDRRPSSRALRSEPEVPRQQRPPVRLSDRSPRATMQVQRPKPPATDLASIVEFANRGDWENASRHCQAILATDSFNAAAHYFYALVLQSSGAAAEGEQELRRAIYLDRGFALAHYQLGLMRKSARDQSGSIKAFRNALDALGRTPDDQSISPCGQITARHLKELAAQQLELLKGQ